ncbi:MAG TPA: hypothetical protein VFX59_20655 [Polyangiales bacterium]|nr:hypothetical protein [Polyangiales bacterium]
MERLVIALLKLVLKLAWMLFRLALRLVLFAWTGDWRKLDKVEAELRELITKAKQPQTVQRQHRSPRARPQAKQAPPRDDEAWPFEFAPELTELEPTGELVGGEAMTRPMPPPVQPGLPRRPPPPPRELPLALALRQPRVMRDAMVLTAALGPRGRRDRRF